MVSKAESDDPVAAWNARIAPLRKRGRRSAMAKTAATGAPAEGELDVRRGRPAAPDRLNADERAEWDRIVMAKRPGWFTGVEALLESYLKTITELQRVEALLRAADPEEPPDADSDAVEGAKYHRLARTHDRFASLASSLATRLRLTPQSRVGNEKLQPHDGDQPVAA